MTTCEGISFAGGDIVRGAATVMIGCYDGKVAARSIATYLSSGKSLKKNDKIKI